MNATDAVARAAPNPGRTALWQRAGNLLLVRLDNLGDVLMTTPALQALGADPGRRLTLLGSRSSLALVPHLPRLDDALVFDAPWVKGPVQGPRAERRFIAQLARRRFDAAIVFTVCTQSALPAALLLRLAGIPLRLAYARENPYELLSDWVPETDRIAQGMRHEVQRQLDLVAAVGFGAAGQAGGGGEKRGEDGALERPVPRPHAAPPTNADPAAAATPPPRLVFVPRTSDTEAVTRRLAAAGIGAGDPYLVLHPGSSAASRRYPPERFGAAAAFIARATGAAIVVAGGSADTAACAEAAAAIGAQGGSSVVLAGEFGLGELGALIGGARLCLCNNSGPAHLAAAMQTPVVVAYALTNPQHTPWGVPARVLSHDVACRDCLKSVCPMRHHRCLLGIGVDELVAAALDLWRETAGRGSSGATVGPGVSGGAPAIARAAVPAAEPPAAPIAPAPPSDAPATVSGPRQPTPSAASAD